MSLLCLLTHLLIIINSSFRCSLSLAAQLAVFLGTFLDPEGSLSATTVVLLVVVLVVLVVTVFQKMPKALLIRNGKLRNFAHTFVTSFPTDLPS